MPISPHKRLRSNDGRSSRASSAGENKENGSGNVAAAAAAAAAAPAGVSAPAVILKPQLKEVKYDESMTPQQWFQDWEHMFLVAFEGNPVSERYKMACMTNVLTREQLQRFTFRTEENTTLNKFKTAFSEIFSRPLPKQFADFEATRMRDNETPRAFHSRCESFLPCIKIGDNKLAQWNFLNKLADNDSQREAMKMRVSNRRWGDILAMIEKLWSSSRGKRRHETVLEFDEEEDEAPQDKENNEDVNAVHSGGSSPNLLGRGRGAGCSRNYKKGRGTHSSSLCFPNRM